MRFHLPPGPVPLDPAPRELDRDQLEAEKQQMRRFVEKARMIPNQGQVWEVLQPAILQEETDLLVLGTHGRKAELSKLLREELLMLQRHCPRAR